MGGDPRLFKPDPNISTKEEIALHKKHCDLCDKLEELQQEAADFMLFSPPKFIDGKHYGVGTYIINI